MNLKCQRGDSRRFSSLVIFTGVLWRTTAFGVLKLLVRRQEEHPARKNWLVRCWRGYLTGASCKWFAYGPADVTATLSSLASLKSRLVLPFWCRSTQVVPEKRPLIGCLSIAENMRGGAIKLGHWPHWVIRVSLKPTVVHNFAAKGRPIFKIISLRNATVNSS